jgi:predicted nucleic acid-binding protein
MRYIIDASVTASWLLPDENVPAAQTILDKLASADGLVPPLWLYEVTNICVMAFRRGRLSQGQLTDALNRMDRLPIKVETDIPLLPIRYLAERYALTIYDAAYLELALRLDGQLATFDKALAAAALANGVLARA